MSKFKVGDRCKVVRNAIAPRNIGQVVTIVRTIGKDGYRVKYDNGYIGIASENCLELFKE